MSIKRSKGYEKNKKYLNLLYTLGAALSSNFLYSVLFRGTLLQKLKKYAIIKKSHCLEERNEDTCERLPFGRAMQI